ncbi:MAG: bifunctional demethylmenaquinone methyltransferase/2-methoxy-6-polyprenyl-1,4-benzoquinol methylase UbiE [Bacteroidetes bacterium]|nr:bifunctional demethylmenaquinone methyltransferase/2-methoxy-6-polyprenyl-1,4-benzoquinol methylase UbiE [Bacteroidota bacterium]
MAQVVPDSLSLKNKKSQVGEMFDDISPRYDLLNRVLSMGIDRGWRKKVVSILRRENSKTILDVATGTGDLAIAIAKLPDVKITGVDISEGMLTVGRKKIENKNLQKIITLSWGDSENLDFADNSFDAITVAFGVRNFENLEKGLAEMYRVLKPDGIAIVLEFSQPQNFIFKNIYYLYFNFVLPNIGKLVSKNINAYSYLPKSVKEFPFGEKFVGILNKQNFKETSCTPLTFGICSIYTGRK